MGWLAKAGVNVFLFSLQEWMLLKRGLLIKVANTRF